MKNISLYQEPSLEHLSFKIILWILSTVFIGVVASCFLVADDDRINRTRSSRSSRSVRVVRGVRTGRVDMKFYKKAS